MNQSVQTRRPRRWLAVFLVTLPAWLIASGGFSVWLYFRNEESRINQIDHAFGRMVSAESLADDVEKITRIIGERHGSSDTASSGLDQTASMIEGSLGPSNTGLSIRKINSPTRWPILTTLIPGSDPDSAPIWLVTSYDSRPGSIGTEANATGLAATMATAQALVNTPLKRSVHFAFLPHANDPDSPVVETVRQYLDSAQNAHLILCIEAMGGSDTLWLTSRNTESPILPLFEGLGEVKGAEVTCLNEDTDIASILFQNNAPAVRIATRAQVFVDDPDDSHPDAESLAAATGRLVTLVQRCAATEN